MTTKQRVLIIDDNEMALRLATYVFRKADYEVYVAGNGIEGLAKVKQIKPNLLILDVMMPDMSGLEVCQRLRADPATASLPIIILSAKDQVDDKLNGFQAGADDYVLKPVAPKELLARAGALLQRVKRSQAPKTQIIAVAGAKGGVGVTTIAVNMATVLATQTEKSVILAELRDHPGTVAGNLNLAPVQGLGDLLAMDPAQISRQDVTRRIIRHNLGLQLLIGPQQFVDHPLTTAHVKVVVEALTEEAERVILDLPGIAGDAMHEALEQAGHILLVTEPEPISVACAQANLKTLRAWGLFDRTNVVIVIRAQSNTLLTPAKIEKELHMAVAGVIPPASEIFYMAASLGNPVVISKPDTLGATALVELTQRLVDQQLVMA